MTLKRYSFSSENDLILVLPKCGVFLKKSGIGHCCIMHKPYPMCEMPLNVKKGEYRRTRRVWDRREGLALFTNLSPLLLGVGPAVPPVPPHCANTRAGARHPGLLSPHGRWRGHDDTSLTASPCTVMPVD